MATGPRAWGRGPGTGGPGISAGLGRSQAALGDLLVKILPRELGLDQCQSGKKAGIKGKRTEVFPAAMGQME